MNNLITESIKMEKSFTIQCLHTMNCNDVYHNIDVMYIEYKENIHKIVLEYAKNKEEIDACYQNRLFNREYIRDPELYGNNEYDQYETCMKKICENDLNKGIHMAIVADKLQRSHFKYIEMISKQLKEFYKRRYARLHEDIYQFLGNFFDCYIDIVKQDVCGRSVYLIGFCHDDECYIYTDH